MSQSIGKRGRDARRSQILASFVPAAKAFSSKLLPMLNRGIRRGNES